MAERLGKYRLLRPLASGGMGEVFLAEQEGPQSFRRRVVLKRLLKHLASDPSFVEMFLSEARVASLISHPNVAQLFELGEENGTYFLAMEYVRGKSLRELLKAVRERGERIGPHIAVAIMLGVLRGVHAAHTLVDESGKPRGCVHRDVSAENVLLAVDGAVKVVDFGIAKALDATTAQGTMLRGKSGYMAPEQYQRGRLDARTDVFAAGVLLYELVAGQRPFVGESEAAVMHAILIKPPPALTTVASCPERLQAIVERALAKDPGDRYPTAEAMARELEVLLDSGELGTGGAGAMAELRGFAQRWMGEVLAGTEERGGGTTATLDTEVLANEAPPGPSAARRTPAPTPSSAAAPRTSGSPPRGALRFTGSRVAFALVAATLGLIVAWQLFAHRRAPAAREAKAESAASVTGAPPPPPDPPPIATPVTSVAAAPSAAPAPSSTAPTPPRAPDPHATRKPAAERPTGTGTLALRVRPWAEIYVDGRSVGLSPVGPIELPAGRHQLLLRNPDLGKERSVTAQITKGETTTVRVDLLQ